MFSLVENEFDYTGLYHHVNLITSLSRSDYEIVMSESDLSASDAGDYNVVIRGKGNHDGEITLPWKIKKASLGEIHISGSETFDYDGNSASEKFGVADSENNPLSDSLFDFIWYDAQTNQKIDAPTDAGSYKVKAITKDPNYENAETEVFKFTINKADLENISVKDDSKNSFVYGEEISEADEEEALMALVKFSTVINKGFNQLDEAGEKIEDVNHTINQHLTIN